MKITNLSDKQERVKANNVAHGWYDEERSFSDDIALLHTEISEAFDAYRSHKFNDATAVFAHNAECALIAGPVDVFECTCGVGLPKPEGYGSELADVLVRLLDTADRYAINLEFERDGIDVTGLLYRKYSDITVGYGISALHAVLSEAWAIEVGLAKGSRNAMLGLLLHMLEEEADDAGLDLAWEFERKMAYNVTRPYRHGNKHL